MRSHWDEDAILSRLNETPPEHLVKSLVAEIVRLGRQQESLIGRVAAVEAMQALGDRVASALEVVPASDYPSFVRVSAEDSLPDASSFYDLEYDKVGRAYRWTGPEPFFSIKLFVNRSAPATFVMAFGRVFADTHLEELKCWIDGRETKLTWEKVGDGYEVAGTLSSRDDAGGTVIAFLVPSMGSPAESGSSDQRRLGLSFRSLVVNIQDSASQAPEGEVHSNPKALA